MCNEQVDMLIMIKIIDRGQKFDQITQFLNLVNACILNSVHVESKNLFWVGLL